MCSGVNPTRSFLFFLVLSLVWKIGGLLSPHRQFSGFSLDAIPLQSRICETIVQTTVATCTHKCSAYCVHRKVTSFVLHGYRYPLAIMQAEGDEYEVQDYTRRHVRRAWAATWCAMLRHNVFACAKDTREGVRRPRIGTARRTGPFPPRDMSSGSIPSDDPRRPASNVLGTAYEPVIVVSGRLNNVESSGKSNSSGGLLLGYGSEPGGSITSEYDRAVPGTSGLLDSNSNRSSNDGSVTSEASYGGQGSVPRGSSFMPTAWRAHSASDGLENSHCTAVGPNRNVGGSVDGSNISEKPIASLQSHDKDHSGRRLVSHGPMSSRREMDEHDSDTLSSLPIHLSTLVPSAGSGSSPIESFVPLGPSSSFVSSHEIETVEAHKSSGRELLCHRDVSGETVLTEVAISRGTAQGGGGDEGQCEGSVGGDEQVKRSSLASFGLFRSKPPAQSDVSRPGSVGSVGYINGLSDAGHDEHLVSSFSADGDSSQGRGLTSSGKKLLYYRDTSKGKLDNPGTAPWGGNGAGECEGSTEGDGRWNGNGLASFRLMWNRPAVESDVPRRSSMRPVGSMGFVKAANEAASDAHWTSSFSAERGYSQDRGLDSSGKKLLYQRDYCRENGDIPSLPPDQQERHGGEDKNPFENNNRDISGVEVDRQRLDGGKLGFRLLRGRPTVASDIPRRGSIDPVGYIESIDGIAVDNDLATRENKERYVRSEEPTGSGKKLLYHRGLSRKDSGQSKTEKGQNRARDEPKGGNHATDYGNGGKSWGVGESSDLFTGGPPATSSQGSSNSVEYADSEAGHADGDSAEVWRTRRGRDKRKVGTILLMPWSARIPTAVDEPRRRSITTSDSQPSQYFHRQQSQYDSGGRDLSDYSQRSMELEKVVERGLDRSVKRSAWGSGRSGFGLFSNRRPNDESCRGSMHFAHLVDPPANGLRQVEPEQHKSEQRSSSSSSGRALLHTSNNSKESGEENSAVVTESTTLVRRKESQLSSRTYIDPEARTIDRDLTTTNVGERDSNNGGDLLTSGRAKERKRGAAVLPWSMQNPITIDVPRHQSIHPSGLQPRSAEPSMEGVSEDRAEVAIENCSIQDAFHGAISLQPRRHDEHTEHCSGSGPILTAAISSGGGGDDGGGGRIRWGLGRSLAVDAPGRRAPIYSVKSSSSSINTKTSSGYIGSNRVVKLNQQDAPLLLGENEGDQDGRGGVMASGSIDETAGTSVVRRGFMLSGIGWKKRKIFVSDVPQRRGFSSGPILVLAPNADAAVGESGQDLSDAKYSGHDHGV